MYCLSSDKKRIDNSNSFYIKEVQVQPMRGKFVIMTGHDYLMEIFESIDDAKIKLEEVFSAASNNQNHFNF